MVNIDETIKIELMRMKRTGFFYSILMLALLPILVNGQTDVRAKEMRERMWKNKLTDIRVQDIPDRWKDESVIILYREVNYEVEHELTVWSFWERLHMRQRLLLKDEAAVKQFSELEFRATQLKSLPMLRAYVGIKIIKPDGKEIEVPLDKGVTMEARSKSETQKHWKIAIPGLEPGDQLDYYYSLNETINPYTGTDRVSFNLHGKYPVYRQKLSIRPGLLQVRIKSLNGAPEMTEAQEDGRYRTFYSLESKLLDKVDTDMPWFQMNRSIPTVLFKVYILYPVFYKLDEDKKLTDKEILRYMNYAADVSLSKSSLRNESQLCYEAIKYVKQKLPDETNPETIVREGFNYFRQHWYVDGLDNTIRTGKVRQTPPLLALIQAWEGFLQKFEIDHHLLLTVPRYYSATEDHILSDDARFLVRVNGPKPFYFWGDFDKFAYFNQISPDYQGNVAYAIHVPTPERKRKLEKLTLPADTHEANKETTFMQVKLNLEDGNTTEVTRQINAEGMRRYGFYEAVTSFDIMDDGRLEQYEVGMDGDGISSRKGKERFEQELRKKKQEEEEERIQAMKKSLQGESGATVKEYKDFKLVQTGVWQDKPTLKFEDKYTLENVFTKNGPNYLLEIGKLIGDQLQISKQQTTRKHDVFMPYARSFQYEVTIPIPNGYEVKGLEKLTNNVTNATGGFVSNAKIEGNNLKISAKKYYIHNFESAAQWPEMVAFLEAAYQFTQQKVLLRKVTGNALSTAGN